LLASTVAGASAGQAAAGAVSTKIAALAEGVMKAMFVTKMKIIVAVLFAVGAVAGAGLFAHLPEEKDAAC
jgi:hypothetical protein